MPITQRILDQLKEAIENPRGSYYDGLRCGVEDQMINDRYNAVEYGWDQAFKYIDSVLNTIDATQFADSIQDNEDLFKEAISKSLMKRIDREILEGEQTPGEISLEHRKTMIKIESSSGPIGVVYRMSNRSETQESADALLYKEAHNVANSFGKWPMTLKNELTKLEELVSQMIELVNDRAAHYRCMCYYTNSGVLMNESLGSTCTIGKCASCSNNDEWNDIVKRFENRNNTNSIV